MGSLAGQEGDCSHCFQTHVETIKRQRSRWLSAFAWACEGLREDLHARRRFLGSQPQHGILTFLSVTHTVWTVVSRNLRFPVFLHRGKAHVVASSDGSSKQARTH